MVWGQGGASDAVRLPLQPSRRGSRRLIFESLQQQQQYHLLLLLRCLHLTQPTAQEGMMGTRNTDTSGREGMKDEALI